MSCSITPNKNDSALQNKYANESERRKSERRHRDSRKARTHRRSGSEWKKISSRRKHSRSPDRSHKREKHSSARRHYGSRSPVRRSRSPRGKSRGCSPDYDKAMHAQERLARRLERAKGLMRQKEGLTKWDEKRESERTESFDEAIKRATDIASKSTTSTSIEGLSSRAAAQIEALRAKALAETGIEVPSYYNPLAINPINYAQQVAKRKKLWSKKDDAEIGNDKLDHSASTKATLWSGVKFADNKSNEKFAKLMGIKTSTSQASMESQDIIKKQAEVFQKLDLQYQQARLATHTQRGVGLGFSSTIIDPNLPMQSNSAAQSSSR